MLTIYILLALLFIVFLLLVIKKLEWGNAISIFFSGFERLSLHIGFTLAPITLFAFALIPVTFIRLYKKFLNIPKPILILSLFVILTNIFSLVFSHYKHVSASSTIFVIIYILLLLTEYVLMREYKTVKQVFLSINLIVFTLSLYAIIQFLRYKFGLYPDLFNTSILRNGALNPLDFTDKGIVRPNSFFNDVNTSAGFLLLYLPLVIMDFWYWVERVRVGRWMISDLIMFLLSTFSLTFSLIAFFMMSSRATLIAIPFMVLISIIYLFIRFKSVRSYISYAFVLLIVVMALILGIKHSVVFNKVSQIYGNEYSARAHLAYTESALREFKKYPVFGGGTGSYLYYFQQEQATGKYGYYPSVDNPPLFIKYLAENGVVGGLVYAAFYLYIFYKGFKASIDLNRKDRAFVLSLLIGFTGLFISNFFHAFFPLYFSAVFIGIFLAIIDLQEDYKIANK